MRRFKSGMFSASLITAALAAGLCPSAFADPKIAVFYPSTIPVKSREKALKQGTGEDVVVFARSKDFLQTLDGGGVPIVIAPPSFEAARTDYEPALQMTLGGKKEFAYQVLSTSKGMDGKQLSETQVGLVEEVERPELKAFFADKVGLKLNKMKTVSKAEDLFPLLVFNAAKAIVVSPDAYAELRKIFTVQVHPVKVDVKAIPYPRVYVKKGETEEDVVKKIAELNKETLNILGFDGVEGVQK